MARVPVVAGLVANCYMLTFTLSWMWDKSRSKEKTKTIITYCWFCYVIPVVLSEVKCMQGQSRRSELNFGLDLRPMPQGRGRCYESEASFASRPYYFVYTHIVGYNTLQHPVLSFINTCIEVISYVFVFVLF